VLSSVSYAKHIFKEKEKRRKKERRGEEKGD